MPRQIGRDRDAVESRGNRLRARLGHAVNAASWDETLAGARGQTVYWHAWGGDPQINAYIEWVGDQVKAATASIWSTSS